MHKPFIDTNADASSGNDPNCPVPAGRTSHVSLEGILTEWSARAEREKPGVAGQHQRAQLGAVHVLIADEGDAPDADLAVLDVTPRLDGAGHGSRALSS